jgi:hypothetical protein
VVSLGGNFELGLRGEYFADDQGARTGVTDLKALNFTVTPALKCDGAIFRLEYRFDNSNHAVFIEKDGTTKHSNTVSFEFSCNF